ncbi:hypothetical protein BGZ61DRAFT_547254 [Ilyonectria robusta]|uniref:uncharacterized protein n=1 Tax=Ilyonectria robusta TaxID=1079257 RepID=UPI001E8D54EE|nr:uncharacterized protein BGZ61DRAFT_547254 [Ilyonectria robusta]KAH8686727.1 hypothetical protein BGZ61DRAFT_547254 [Ilyonectria robusta]
MCASPGTLLLGLLGLLGLTRSWTPCFFAGLVPSCRVGGSVALLLFASDASAAAPPIAACRPALALAFPAGWQPEEPSLQGNLSSAPTGLAAPKLRALLLWHAWSRRRWIRRLWSLSPRQSRLSRPRSGPAVEAGEDHREKPRPGWSPKPSYWPSSSLQNGEAKIDRVSERAEAGGWAKLSPIDRAPRGSHDKYVISCA